VANRLGPNLRAYGFEANPHHLPGFRQFVAPGSEGGSNKRCSRRTAPQRRYGQTLFGRTLRPW
jgi:hypothetical protein